MLGHFRAIDISASGLTAERLRMEVIANNIANAETTRTPEGEPYRRKAVVFSAAIDERADTDSIRRYQGVQVLGVHKDPSEFPMVHDPNHPHANEDGFVMQSNTKIPDEMVDLITASRAYEANSRAISMFKEMMQQTLSLLQGSQG